ncbi:MULTISPECIES: alpha/beta fold hydrolase [Bradyrhizobium]|uniref:alpha/beta fold hydrolase n=1 Tax=Bradyrhizobium elkanii TaxID=29448 RepID=UPI001AEC36DC|nr:alpha/beta fold hydrolase [Bradyrhizobium elkanii]
MTTFVLVHGAWHGGWCYERVARLLRQAGHEVYPPTLTGLGERAHLMNRGVDLGTHVQDIVGVIRGFVECGAVWPFLWWHGHHWRRRADRAEDPFAGLS